MELRCMARTALSARPCFFSCPAAASRILPALSYTSRQFSSSVSRLSDPDPFSKGNAWPQNPPSDSASGPSPSRPISMADLLGLKFSSSSTHIPPSRHPVRHAPTSILGNILPADSFSSPLSGIPPLPKEKLPRMGPTAGRSVVVTSDLAQAFTRLKIILSQNRVRQDEKKQRFHESPGVKRKRLRSERHRIRFKAGFKRMVGVVLEMKKMGM